MSPFPPSLESSRAILLAARREPTFSELFESLEEFKPVCGSVYLFGTSSEDRSAHAADWEAQAAGVRFVRLLDHSPTSARFEVDDEQVLMLRNAEQLQAFLTSLEAGIIYIDITGLGHNVWAPLLRAALELPVEVRVVYVEPTDYTQSAAPTEGEIFDLSERITGIAPLPGFASLARGVDDDYRLIVLLGFEGTRFAYLLENVQPRGEDRVIPLVGAPGFRSEYPFYAYHGNKSPLIDTRAWASVRYVTANCPFRVFHTLASVEAESSTPVKVAPIGTKPHALAAVLYAIRRAGEVELVYDHPVRTAKRTKGASRALVYHVSTFLGGYGSK